MAQLEARRDEGGADARPPRCSSCCGASSITRARDGSRASSRRRCAARPGRPRACRPTTCSACWPTRDAEAVAGGERGRRRRSISMSDDDVAQIRRRSVDRRARRDRAARARLPGARARHRPAAAAAGAGAGGGRGVAGRRGAGFDELWGKVESMVTSYSDANYVSRRLRAASCGRRRRQAVDVERTSDDPARARRGLAVDGQRRARSRRWTTSCSTICSRSRRIRRAGATSPRPSAAHAEDLVRVGYFDQAWQLADAVDPRRRRPVPAASSTSPQRPPALRPRTRS